MTFNKNKSNSNLDSLVPRTKEQIEAYNEAAKANGLPLLTIPHEPIYDKIADVINSLGTGMTQNLADIGTGGYNLLSKIIPGLKAVAPPDIAKGLLPSVRSGIHPTVEEVGEFADPVAWMAPELKLGETLGLGGEAAGLASRLAGKAVTGAATGGAYGALLSPLHQGAGAGIGGLAGAGLATILGLPAEGIGSMVDRLRRRSLEKGTLLRTPKEVEEIINKTTPVYGEKRPPFNLGDLIQSAPLSTLYHDTLSSLPFSGARGKAQQVLDMARSHARNITKMLKHEVDPAKVDTYLLDKVKGNYKSIRKVLSARYDNIYARAKNLGLSTIPTNTTTVAKNLLKKYSKPEMEDLLNNEAIKSLKRGAGIKKVLDKKTGFKIIVPPEIEREREKGISSESTFEVLRNNISAYGKKARRAGVQGERTVQKVYIKLQEATRKDLENTINESGDETLKSDLKKVNKDYKNHQVPYQTSEMNRLRLQKKSPDNIHNILLKGDNLPLVAHLEDKDKDILAYKKLYKSLEKEGIGKEITNPFKLVRYYDSLSPKQQEALFNARPIREEFNKLRVLTKASKEPALKEDRPYTGARVVGKSLKFLPAFLGGGAVFAPHLIPELAATLGATIGGGRALSSALTSKWLRKAYISGKVPKVLGSGVPTHLLTRLMNLGVGQYLGDKRK